MTITLRARVYKHRSPSSRALIEAPWVAVLVSVDDGPDPDAAVEKYRRHAFWDEAMQTAHQMLAERDRELMAEVHESRSTRYAARVEKIAAEAHEAHPPLVPVFPMIPGAVPQLRSVSLVDPSRVAPEFAAHIAHRFEATA